MIELTNQQVDIIMILADNEGHPLQEFTKLMGKKKTNLFKQLKFLDTQSEELAEKYNHFEGLDVKDAAGLIKKLRKDKDPLSCYFRELMAPGFKALLQKKRIDNVNYKSKDMIFMNIGLTLLLKENHLYNEKCFKDILLSETTRQLMEQNPEGFSLIRLNRLLLEDAYPEELKKPIKTIIFEGTPRPTRNPESKHPGQSETPYFINQDTRIFEIIIENLKEKAEWAKINLRHIEDLCKNKTERLRNRIGSEGLELNQDELNNVLYKEHNQEFYSEVCRIFCKLDCPVIPHLFNPYP